MTSFFVFGGDFEETLSNSVSTTNFVITEQETTKIGGHSAPFPYFNDLKMAHTK